MLQLLILRHAKAADPSLYPTDFERPLTDKGRRECESQRAALAKISFNPDLVLCSPAERTRQTTEGVLSNFLRAGVPVRYPKAIYEASLANLIDVLEMEGRVVQNLAIVGHNPSISNLAQRLSGSKAGPFDTCGAALLAWKQTDWHDALQIVGEVLLQNTPKV